MSVATPSTPQLMISTALALLRRPDLWVTACRQATVLAPDGWWRRAPFLPLPDPAYLRFRLITAYGGEGVSSGEVGRDLVTYLDWCRRRPLG